MSTPLEELWEKNAPAAKALNKQVWNTVWEKGAAQIYVDAQKSAAQMIKAPYVLNPKQVMEYYNKHGLELVKTLSETDKKIFKEVLGNNFNATRDQFKNAFRNSFHSSDARINAIWDTERHNALTHGYDDFVKAQIDKTGIQIEKTWHHSGNPHPREHHIAMHGITVDYNEDFPNGEDVPEGIHCGCWLEYREKDPAKRENIISPNVEYDNNIGFMDIVNEAVNADDIGYAFAARHPEIAFDASGMNLDMAKSQAISLDRVLRDVTGIKEKELVEYVHSLPANDVFFYRPGFGQGHPYATTIPGEIVFNEGYFGLNPTFDLAGSIRHDISVGFHPKDFSPEWIVTHEIGHRVFDHIVITDVNKGREIFDVVKTARDSGELRQWGEYAVSDPGEGVAEIFAGIYHTPAQDQPWFVKKVAEIIFRE